MSIAADSFLKILVALRVINNDAFGFHEPMGSLTTAANQLQHHLIYNRRVEDAPAQKGYHFTARGQNLLLTQDSGIFSREL